MNLLIIILLMVFIISFIVGSISEILFWLFVWQYDITALINIEEFDLTF